MVPSAVGHTAHDAGLCGQVQHHQHIGDDVKRCNQLLGKDGVCNVKDLGIKEEARVAHADKIHPVGEGLGAKLLEMG